MDTAGTTWRERSDAWLTGVKDSELVGYGDGFTSDLEEPAFNPDACPECENDPESVCRFCGLANDRR